MKHANHIGVVFLAVLLALSLCGCSVVGIITEKLGGLFGGKEAQSAETATETAAYNVGSLSDYAERLAEAGVTEAADAVREKVTQAEQMEADRQALKALEGDARIDMVRRIARTDTAEVLRQQETAGKFSDVSESDWFYDAVKWAAAQGIVSGESFSPNSPATRAQVLTFLWRAKGAPVPTLQNSPFADVKESNYYYEPALWAFETGLIGASKDGKFHADDSVTRAQTVTFLYRAEGEPAVDGTSPFADVQDSDWFASAAIWAYTEGIVTLNSEKTFNPQGKCTRAQYVNFLYCCYGA